MDEREVTGLFHAATEHPPPPSFDVNDIATAARRADARRRKAVLTGAGSGVAVIIAAAITVPLVLGGAQQSAGSSAAAPFVASSTHHSPTLGPDNQKRGDAGPLIAGGGAGCGTLDDRLAVALASELPTRPPMPATPAAVSCAAGTYSAAYRLPDGVIAALVVPRGKNPPVVPGPDQARSTASGATVVVFSTAKAGQRPPLRGSLAAIADALARRF